MNTTFEIAGGSVLGRSHRHTGKNNQDALCCFQENDSLVAVVCDGCGSGAHSEVGAQIGARLVARSLMRQASRQSNFAASLAIETMLEGTRLAVLKRLRFFAKELDNSLSSAVNDYLLFTIGGALITPRIAVFFSLGDGVLAVNDEVILLGPFPDNAPPYLAYCLTDTKLPLEVLRFQVQRVLETEKLRSFLIGSDGVEDVERAANNTMPGKSEVVGPLCQFWQEDRFFSNPDMVRRRLAGINRDVPTHQEFGLLPDDTTLVVGRRKEMRDDN